MITILLTIYLSSLATMFIITKTGGAWENDCDRKLSIITTFTPLLNTIVICIGLFYCIPQQIIETHKNKQKNKFKNDKRWNLMNNRENE